MSPFLLRRLCEGVGVSCIYGISEKYRERKMSVNDDVRIKELNELKLNLAFEGNEILQNLSHALFLELELLKQRGELEKDFQIPVGHASKPYVDPRIKDKLRLISQSDLKFLDLSNQRIRGGSGVMGYFRMLEAAVYHKYTQKQLQISRAIRFYKSKLYSEHNQLLGIFNTSVVVGAQVIAIPAFLRYVSHRFRAEHTRVPPPMPSRLKALLCMLPLCAAAMYLSPLDLLANTASAEEEIDLELRTADRLPRDPFAGLHIPEIHCPVSSPDNPWGGALIYCILRPMVEGFIFRRYLLDAFLTTAGPWQAHFLVATAATAVNVVLDLKHEHYYQLKSFRESTDDYNFMPPPDASVHTLSLPYRSFLLQWVSLLTGRLYLSIGMDTSLRLLHVLRESSLREDLIVSADSMRPYYGMAQELLAAVGAVSFMCVALPLRFFHSNKMTPEAAFADKIIAHQQKLSNCSDVANLSFMDSDFLVTSLAFHVGKLQHCSMDDLLPPKCEEGIQDTDDTSPSAASRNSTVGRTDHSDEIASLLSEDGYAAMHLFIYETDRLLSEKYLGGKSSGVVLRTELASLLRMHHQGNEMSGKSSDELVRRVFFWDECASEENVLDLLQEKHAHVRRKLRRCAEEYAYTVGSLQLLLLQGKEEVTESDLREYFDKLEYYIQVVKKREEVLFCELFGLTKGKYDYIMDKWKANSEEVIELDQAWVKYFDSPVFKQEILSLADPHAVLKRASNDDTFV